MPRRLILQSLVILAAIVAAIAPVSAELVERWYTSGAYPPLQRTLTSLSNLTPIPWLDVLLVATAVLFVRLWWRALRADASSSRTPRVLRAALSTGFGAACVYLAFLALWGLNYRQVPLARELVFDKPAPSDDEVARLGLTAVERVNALHASAHRAGWHEPVWQDDVLTTSAARVQRLLGRRAPAVLSRLKWSMLGQVYRWNGVDAMTSPFGLEVLTNPDLLPYERPFVAAHEWAHLAGYADESEANFVAWLTCVNGDVPAQYSGWLFLYWNVAGQVGAADRRRLDAALASGPRGDLQAIEERLRRSELPLFQQVSSAAYDRYLKANRVEAGIRSYGLAVTLILRARFEDGWHPVRRDAAAPAPAR